MGGRGRSRRGGAAFAGRCVVFCGRGPAALCGFSDNGAVFCMKPMGTLQAVIIIFLLPEAPSPFATPMSLADNETYSAQVAPEFAPAQFVRWFREVAPYVHDFRGKTFVVAFGGELVRDGVLNSLIQDLSLLSALGVKLILVHGSRPQVNEQL